MTNNANGISQYLVLDSLEQGSKYGLEIIEYVNARTGGNIIMKKPTLYSCLTRLEKKGLVSSSFWGESEMGGKRHYYNITSSGKQALQNMAQEFENANFAEELSAPETNLQAQNLQEKDDGIFITERLEESKQLPLDAVKQEDVPDSFAKSTIVLQQDNIFDLVNQKKSTPAPQQQLEQKEEVAENQIDLFSFQQTLHQENLQSEAEGLRQNKTSVLEEQVSENKSTENEFIYKNASAENNPQNMQTEENQNSQRMEYYQSILESDVKNDSKFLQPTERLTSEQELQNKVLYDTSAELKKYRKRKSFSENQIEMAVSYETEEQQEIQRNRIAQLKASMLNARQNHFDDFQTEDATNVPAAETWQSTLQQETLEEEAVQDDAVFITTPRVEEIPTQRKIAPTNIDVMSDGNLPAPKRNASLEPTYKDMLSKLFESKKEKQAPVAPQQEIQIEELATQSDYSDFDSLKKYYQGHGIEFKEYNKANVQRSHNTYFLNFLSSAILLLLSGVGCAVIFGILSGLNLLSASTNFLFYTVPILFFVFCILCFVRDKLYVSKKAYFKYNSIVNWALFLLCSLVVLVANVIAGMQYEIMLQYLTSLLIPVYALLLAFPVHYYIKKFMYNKFSK